MSTNVAAPTEICGAETDKRIEEIADSEGVQEGLTLDRQFPSSPIG